MHQRHYPRQMAIHLGGGGNMITTSIVVVAVVVTVTVIVGIVALLAPMFMRVDAFTFSVYR